MSASIEQITVFFTQEFDNFITNYYDGSSGLAKACRYALTTRGKYVRPILVLAVADLLGSNWQCAMAGAVAVELIHTYSLVHDDLPAMDNDSMRRGHPTVHCAYDAATAILVGDALLADAFEVVADPKYFAYGQVSSSRRNQIVATLAQAAGSKGMVCGQYLDMQASGLKGASNIELLNLIQRQKTAALISASCTIGAHYAGARSAKVRYFAQFGLILGVLFQIVDDLLDNAQGIGKTSGKDFKDDKLTAVKVHGRQKAQQEVLRLRQQLLLMLASYTKKPTSLTSYILSLVNRCC